MLADAVQEPAEQEREKCLRIEDIVSIADAWDVVRGNDAIPKELNAYVGEVRGPLGQKQLRPYLVKYGIREKRYVNKQRLD